MRLLKVVAAVSAVACGDAHSVSHDADPEATEQQTLAVDAGDVAASEGHADRAPDPHAADDGASEPEPAGDAAAGGEAPAAGAADTGAAELGSAAPERVYVWLAVGESNMAGSGALEEVASVFPDYPSSALSMVRSDLSWQPLSEPTADDGPGVGPAGFFAALLSQACNGRAIAVVNVAVGGVRSDQWLPGDITGLYLKTLTRLRAALQHPGAQLAGVLHFDGLNNAARASPSTWTRDWNAVRAALRRDLGDVIDQLPWLYANIRGVPQSYPNSEAVIAEQDAWQGERRVEVAVPAEGPWHDPSHLATAGNLELAKRFRDALLERFGCGE